MNISFHKILGGQGPPANYGRYAYDFLSLLSRLYIAAHCGYELDEIRPIFSTLQLLHVQCTSTLMYLQLYTVSGAFRA